MGFSQMRLPRTMVSAHKGILSVLLVAEAPEIFPFFRRPFLLGHFLENLLILDVALRSRGARSGIGRKVSGCDA